MANTTRQCQAVGCGAVATRWSEFGGRFREISKIPVDGPDFVRGGAVCGQHRAEDIEWAVEKYADDPDVNM